MPAVAEAREILAAFPFDPLKHSKGAWLRAAGAFFRLTPSQAKKIYYREIKGIDADRLEAMRERHADLKAQANANQARLNELVFLRAALRTRESGDAVGNRHRETARGGHSEGSGGGGIPGTGPAGAAIAPTDD